MRRLVLYVQVPGRNKQNVVSSPFIRAPPHPPVYRDYSLTGSGLEPRGCRQATDCTCVYTQKYAVPFFFRVVSCISHVDFYNFPLRDVSRDNLLVPPLQAAHLWDDVVLSWHAVVTRMPCGPVSDGGILRPEGAYACEHGSTVLSYFWPGYILNLIVA